MESFKFTIRIIDQFVEQLEEESRALPSVSVVYTDKELAELPPAQSRIIGAAFDRFNEERVSCPLVVAVTTKFRKDFLSVRVEAA